MRYSQLFGHTNKSAKEFDSINATLLQKGGFISQEMAGVYTFLPLGLRVLTRIEQIIREAMNPLASELLMPALSSKERWRTTGRLDSIDVLLKAVPANTAAGKQHNAEYILNPTHEDVVTPLAQQFQPSYKELPFAVYQIQTKFRNEPRAKSGLLRGREFRMKDLYSFHASAEDFHSFYENVKGVYATVFDQLGLGADTYLTVASGGDFTTEHSHEFQTVCETGEDIILIDEKQRVAYNKDVAPKQAVGLQERRACEVGNIFPLGTRFSEACGYFFTDEAGTRRPVYMGSYGLGSSRIMGVLVEKFHDEQGIIWPAPVAPYQVHLLGLNLDDKEIQQKAEKLYQQLVDRQVAVLYDDRSETRAGEKFSDADIIGIPWRIVVSRKTGEKIEVKQRSAAEATHMSLEEFLHSSHLAT